MDTTLQTSTRPTYTAIDSYASSTCTPNIKGFTEHLRAASAASSVPLRRMAGPGSLRRAGTEDDGRNTVPLWVGPHGMMADVPGVGTMRIKTDTLDQALSSARYLLMPLTPQAAFLAESYCQKRAGSSTPDAEVSQLIAVLRRMECSSMLLVLTSALARTFWTPAGMDGADLPGWCAAFRVSNDPAGWRLLAQAVLNPASDHEAKHTDENGIVTHREYGQNIMQMEDKVDKSILRRRSTTNAAAAYDLVTSIDEQWGAICRTDALLIPYHLLRGEVVEVHRRSWQGSQVAGVLSTPCKVRTGSVLVMLGRRVVDMELAGLGFDNDRDELVGLFGKRKATRGNTAGRGRYRDVGRVAALHDLHDHAGSVYMTTAPFMGAGRSSSIFKWASGDTKHLGVLAPMDMPVDIAVAGAPVE